MGFEQLLGNERLKDNLRQSLRSGRTSHFYLISGPAGSGKRTLAKRLAAAILCKETNKPCGVCSACRKVMGNGHPDFITIDDPEKKTVSVDGVAVQFSKKEFEILYLLASNIGKIFSREDLINELWKDAPYVLDRTVDVHIARIRSKLGVCKGYLTNRSGYGYTFNSLD